MTTRKIKKIASLRIGEISLVPDGDDPQAHVMIVKRRPDIDNVAALRSELAELAETNLFKGADMKTIEQLTEELAKIEKSIESKDAEIAKAKAEVEAKDAEIVKLKGERDEAIAKAKPAETDEEAILKALPESVRVIINKARDEAAAATAVIEKMASEREIGAEVEIAKGLKVGKADELGGLLHRIRKGKTTEADHAAVVDILKQASTISKDSPLFKSSGTAMAGDCDDPEQKIKAKADEIKKAKPELTDAQAYSAAIEAEPNLYNEYIAKKRG